MASTNISDLPYTTPPVAGAPQQAARLPDRDIPRETIQHTIDPQTNVQYLPPRPPDYIPAAAPPAAKLDYAKLYDELRVPVMLTLLYFVFQLDSFQGLLRKIIPALFSESGQLTSKGVFVKSGLFGGAFYLMTFAMQQLSRP